MSKHEGTSVNRSPHLPAESEQAVNCLETAWKDHAPEMRSWLRHRLNQPQDVDDMMQDLFMKALRQGSRFCSVLNARAWLFEVARNALADRLKLRHEMVELPDDLPAVSQEEAPVDKLTACLPRVLSELKASDREAIVLCDLGNLSQADYAAQVGLKLSAAKSRLQRARLRLQKRMTVACQVQVDETGHIEGFVSRPPLDQQG
jgi:RNA polymerase sigma-70 factor (ECF subfamily)